MVRAEQDHRLSEGEYYDEALGEVPPPHVPGVRRVGVPGIRNHRGFLKAMRKGGPVRDLINKLYDEGKHVGASWSGHSLSNPLSGSEVILYVAKHRKAILGAAGVLAAIAGTAGTIYLTRRSPRKK